MSPAKRRPFPSLAKLAFSGALAGMLFSVAGCHWLLFIHEEDDFAFCDESYEDCMAIAISDADRAWCVEDVKSCYESCEGGWDGDEYGDDYGDDGGGPSDSGDGGGPSDTGGSTDGGDEGNPEGGDEGEEGTTEGGEEGGENTEVCIELFGNCIDNAETLQDVEACEALYDQCIDPGECPEDECGCPAEELESCLDDYAYCADLADAEKLELCEQNFDTCTAPFADACQVDENPNIPLCLDQHALCVACAEGEEQLAACQDVFDTCLAK